MDLGAFVNIGNDDIEEIVKKNKIDCPRLRGYRLMENEEPINYNGISEEEQADVASRLCCSIPFWSEKSTLHEFSERTNNIEDYYVPKDENGDRHICWDRIHGEKREILKTAIHNKEKRYREQYDVWNKYAGRADILYIHARIGGGNWPYYYKEVVDQPWFIEKVDDAFDDTYCDIYARIER